MPAKRKHDHYLAKHFAWSLYTRNDVWWADGRSNLPTLGRFSLGSRDLTEAKAILADLDLKMAVEHGLAAPSLPAVEQASDQPLPLEDGVQKYLAHVGRDPVLGGLRESSRVRYETALKNFQAYAKANGVRVWNLVGYDFLQNYSAFLTKEKYAYRTRYFTLTTVMQTHGFLISKGFLPQTSKFSLKLKKPSGSDTYCFTPAQVEAMFLLCLERPEKLWLYHAILAMAFTGMRIGELCSLRWANVDLVQGMIALRDESASSVRDTDRVLQTVKGRRNRMIPIHSRLRPVLEGLERRTDGYVFSGPHSKRLKAPTVRVALQRDLLTPLAEKFPTAANEIGFAHARPHSFRHYFCSMCASRGVAQNVVQKWLGHKDSQMIDYYFSLHNDEARQQIERLAPSADAAGA